MMEQSANRTYRLRGSRITGPQQSALDKYWGSYGIEYQDELLDITSLFPDSQNVIMEIGFGMGEATALIARDFPETGFLAVEVHRPGIGKLMLRIQELNLSNIRIIEGDAHPIIASMIPDAGLDGIHLFFPDPWPKKRHHKRRVIRPATLDLYARVLQPGGKIYVSTDAVLLWEYMVALLNADDRFEWVDEIGRAHV